MGISFDTEIRLDGVDWNPYNSGDCEAEEVKEGACPLYREVCRCPFGRLWPDREATPSWKTRPPSPPAQTTTP